VQKLLTEIVLKKLKWNGTTSTYWDKALPAFGVRVGKRTKTFIVMTGKKRIAQSIGHYPSLSLKDARIKAIPYLDTQDDTPKPSNAKDEFLDSCKRRLKLATVQQYKSYLDYIDLPLQSLTKPEIMRQLNTWEDKPSSQNYA